MTAKGRQMARLPLEPPLAAALLAAVDLRCVRDCVAAVSMVSADRVLVTPRQQCAAAADAFAVADVFAIADVSAAADVSAVADVFAAADVSPLPTHAMRSV